MNKIFALIVLSITANYAFASGNIGGLIFALFTIVIIMQIMITILDYKFTRNIKGSVLLNVLFFAGIFLFNAVMVILENHHIKFEGLIFVVLGVCLYVFPWSTKTLTFNIIKKSKNKKPVL